MAFNGRFVLNMAHLASKQGGELLDLVTMSGKSLEELNQEDCIIDNTTYNRIIESIVKSLGDQNFGLHAGENLNLSAAGLILQLVQTSPTIKQAYELCCKYANLGCSALPMELRETKEGYKLVMTPDMVWRNDSEIAFQQTTLGVVAFKIKEFHSLSFLQQSPQKVTLSWKRPQKWEEIENVYGCPVEFEKEEIAIHFLKEQIEVPIITSNYSLLQTLISHAEEISNKKKKVKGFSSVVAQSIVNLIKPEFPSLEQVASHLNLSTRTLQRKLKAEGLSFKKIIEDLKKEFALGYIKKQELNISDIAYLLSYTEVSAFTRSFKRWTGKSPLQYRKDIPN